MTMPADGTAKGTKIPTGPAQKIVPHLWFDTQAEEAVDFYTSIFPDSTRGAESRYSAEGQEIHGMKPGTLMNVDFSIAGTRLLALNGGPHFKFTPAISLFVHCDTVDEVDRLWEQLADGGTALMELDSYDWSDRYGWIQDRFGLSWQLIRADIDQVKQRLEPCLLFTGDEPQAQEAMELYTSIFPDSKIESASPHASDGPMAGMIAHAQFTLFDEVFTAMDGGPTHPFTFNEAISLLVECEDQAEIDRYWDQLSAGGDPKAQQCGWLKDRFGVSWQISPEVLGRMMTDPDRTRVDRVIATFMPMKKLDIAQLEAAYRGDGAS